MTRYGTEHTLTQEELDIIATYMDDEIREDIAYKLAPCTPEAFLRAYAEEDESFKELLEIEFSIVL